METLEKGVWVLRLTLITIIFAVGTMVGRSIEESALMAVGVTLGFLLGALSLQLVRILMELDDAR